MIVLGGTLRILAEDRERILHALQDLQDATWANDEGVASFHFSIDLKDENLIHVYEEWETIESLKAHGKKEHMNPLRALRAEKQIEIVRFNRWRAEELGEF